MVQTAFSRPLIRVLLIEDHPVVGAGLSFELEKKGGFQVVGLFDNVPDTLTALAQKPVDVILSDLYLSESASGIQVMAALANYGIGTPVLIMSSDERPQTVQQALAAGAAGFIGKHSTATEFLEGMRWATRPQRSEPYIAPLALRQRMKQVAQLHPTRQHDTLQKLTEKELETLRLFGQGLSPKEIAFEQGRIVTTVYSHLTKVREKLNISHEVELRNFAIRHLLNVPSPTV
jgi:DNA-binding NarL/FixJ family response regulator